jgi:myosin heavy chain 9/10/11/14
MSAPPQNGAKWRNSPFTRNTQSPSPGPTPVTQRPKSIAMSSSPFTGAPKLGHSRNQSFSPLGSTPANLESEPVRIRSNSYRNNVPAGTFAPQFIKAEDMQDATDRIRGIEGENDFSGKRYVWLKDAKTAFVRGWVVEELDGGKLLIQCDDGTVGYRGLSWTAHLTDYHNSNERPTPRVLIKSTRQSLTKQTIWPSSHTSTNLLSYTTCT